MKSRVKKRVIALMLCMVMVLSSGISTLAEGDAGTPEATEEVNSTTDESTVNTEADTADVTDAQSRMNTAAETEKTTGETVPTESETTDTTTQESVTDDTAVTETAEDEAEAQSTEPAETENSDAATQRDAAASGSQTEKEAGQSTDQTAENVESEPESQTQAARAPGDNRISTIEPADFGYEFKTITQSEWESLINNCDIETATETNVPITNWRRSDPEDPYERQKLNMDKTNGDWTWSDIVENLNTLPITGDNVWDGSRRLEHNYSEKLRDNQVTVYDGKLYDSATWTFSDAGNSNSTKTSLYRFQGEVDLTNLEGNVDDYAFTLSQVTGKDLIYINDDIFVFVYPEGTTLTDDNFTQYLAFWTGTIQNDRNAGYPTTFHNVDAASVVESTNEGDSGDFGRLTDNWSMKAVTDNIGGFLNAGKTKYIIDVIVDDYSAGGGMYRLQLSKEKVQKTPVSLLKVDEEDQEKFLSGASFEVTGVNGNSYRATGTTDENGLLTFNLIDGTYTLKETVSPNGYLDNNKTWTINVSNGTCTIRENGGGYLEKNDEGQFIITNEKDVTAITGDLKFTKTNSDGTVKLPGAEFTLYKPDGTTVVNKGVSNAEGIVTINDIPYGEGYILKETKAPVVGDVTYALSDDTWIVNVDDTGRVTMYLSTDTDNPVSVIPNYTESEELLRGLETDKTVTLGDPDETERVFQVMLNAYSTGSTTIEGMSDIDVMFVLDRSPSMQQDGWESDARRKGWLESAVKSFLDQMITQKSNGKLENSRVAIVEFGGWATDVTNGWKSSIDELTNLKNTYSLGKTTSTNMAEGLEKAYNNYYKYGASYPFNSENKQIIITLTDGKNSWPSYDESALSQATTIKNNVPGITFYGIGLGIESDSDGGRFLQSLIPNAIDKQLWFVSDNEGGDKLSKVFEDIFHSSTETDVYKNAKVIDYIDSRFQYRYKENGEWKVYTDEHIQDYQAEHGGAGIELDNGGFLKYDTEKKCQYIEWTQDIGAKDKEDEFKKNFYIKAKDDFIGGNMVPTNGADSGIYIDEDETVDKTFPQPSVNVYPLSLELQDKEITVYKGDRIDPKDFAEELASELKVVELDNTTKVTTGVSPKDQSGNPTFPELTPGQITELEANGTITLGENQDYKYIYPDTSDAVGYFVYTYQVSDTPGGNMAEHQMNNSGDRVEVYELKVEFRPYSVDQRDNASDLSSEVQRPSVANGGTELDLTNETTKERLTADAEYVVNVISGEIQITKKVDKPSDKAREFTFEVKKDDETFITVTITIPADKTEAQYTGDALKDLERGTYVVKETTSGYAVTELVIGGSTNCYSDPDIDSKTATFILGHNKKNQDVISNGQYTEDGVLGVVEYTNDRIVDNWQIIKRSGTNHENLLSGAVFKLEGVMTYYGKSNSEGVIEWFTENPNSEEFNEAEDHLEDAILKGSYTFSELTAPAGYEKSSETWEIEFAAAGQISSIISSADPDKTNMVETAIEEGTPVVFYFDNEMLYKLPESGGSGIYWYMLGGVLLMMAGSLLVYKKRRGEVLRRK